MRKFILGCLGVAAAALAVQWAQADVQAGVFNDCSPCEEVQCNPCDVACGKKSLWFFGGHMEAGAYANEYGVTDIHGADIGMPGAGLVYPGNSPVLQNVRQTDFQMNQLYFFGGKKLSGRGWDVGGQVDFMFGTDARLVQSAGLEYDAGRGAWDSGDYYTAIPQMFVEVGYNTVSVKIGKFLTPLGHEGVLSTDRFFYSLSDAFALNPITHSGALATWKPNKRLTAFGGWVNGENQFFDTSDDNAFLGGFNFKLNRRVSLGYSVLIGQDERDEFSVSSVFLNGATSAYRSDRDYFVQSFVVGVQQNKKWNNTFELTIRNEKSEDGNAFTANGDSYAQWRRFRNGGYGINQELIYRMNRKWSFGLRAEWVHWYNVMHDVQVWEQGGAVAATYDRWGGGLDKYGFALAANWTPNNWLTVRPEMRYDKFDGIGNDFFNERNGRARDKQFSGGVSAIVSF